MHNRLKREEGFTLIELLVVIIIIGILAAIAIPTFLSQRERAYDAAAQSDARNAMTAQELYQVQNGKYTSSLDDLTAQGFRKSPDVTVAIISAKAATSTTAPAYCMSSKHASGANTFYATNGAVSRTVCT